MITKTALPSRFWIFSQNHKSTLLLGLFVISTVSLGGALLFAKLGAYHCAISCILLTLGSMVAIGFVTHPFLQSEIAHPSLLEYLCQLPGTDVPGLTKEVEQGAPLSILTALYYSDQFLVVNYKTKALECQKYARELAAQLAVVQAGYPVSSEVIKPSRVLHHCIRQNFTYAMLAFFLLCITPGLILTKVMDGSPTAAYVLSLVLVASVITLGLCYIFRRQGQKIATTADLIYLCSCLYVDLNSVKSQISRSSQPLTVSDVCQLVDMFQKDPAPEYFTNSVKLQLQAVKNHS